MGAAEAVFRFENAVPTTAEIVARFKDRTGLDLEVNEFDKPTEVMINHPTFAQALWFWTESNEIHHEFLLGLYEYPQYVFWSILIDLGARPPSGWEILIPKWTQKQWKDVKWWERSSLLNNPGEASFIYSIGMLERVFDIPVRILIFLDQLKKQR